VWWCVVELEDQGEANNGAAAPKWSPEMTGDMAEQGRMMVHVAGSVQDARRE
jgi:hypothetical protein